MNRKVLLREHKRHTARRVASARYADLSRGVPHLRSGGYPIPGLGGVPHPRPRGVPHPISWGVPHPRSRGYLILGLGGTPSHVQGVPHPRVGRGVPGVPPII